MTTPADARQDKLKKMHGEEIDISNGALFLRIAELERLVKYLDNERAKMQSQIDRLQDQARDIPFRVGGGNGF